MRIFIIQAETSGLSGTAHCQSPDARPLAFQQASQTRPALAAPEGGDQ